LITSSPVSTKFVLGTRLAVAVDFIETLDAIYTRLICYAGITTSEVLLHGKP
jgi:hypothetical protein